jgi:hypothetical protein
VAHSMASSAVGSFTAAKSVDSKKFTLAEIADCRVKGLCFRCDEKITPDHKEECKHLFIVKVLVLDDEEEDCDPTISLRPLTGIQPKASRTMQVSVSVGGVLLNALLDSGSTHNFINTGATMRAASVSSQGVASEWQSPMETASPVQAAART